MYCTKGRKRVREGERGRERERERKGCRRGGESSSDSTDNRSGCTYLAGNPILLFLNSEGSGASEWWREEEKELFWNGGKKKGP